MALHEKRCVPCEGGVPPLTADEQAPFLAELNDDWNVVRDHHLERTWAFSDFAAAIEFVNSAGGGKANFNYYRDSGETIPQLSKSESPKMIPFSRFCSQR